MLNTRTKVLFMTSLLAPAAVVVSRWTMAMEKRSALERGALGVWVDPAPIFPFLFVVGCLSFILAIISTVADVRSQRP
jgi:hypothetical protein